MMSINRINERVRLNEAAVEINSRICEKLRALLSEIEKGDRVDDYYSDVADIFNLIAAHKTAAAHAEAEIIRTRAAMRRSTRGGRHV